MVEKGNSGHGQDQSNECYLRKVAGWERNASWVTHCPGSRPTPRLTPSCNWTLSAPLEQVAPVLKERMVKKGSMMIGYQPHGTRGNFFRMVVANPALTRADMDFLLNELERLGQDL